MIFRTLHQAAYAATLLLDLMTEARTPRHGFAIYIPDHSARGSTRGRGSKNGCVVRLCPAGLLR
jgi:hypothetical protein